MEACRRKRVRRSSHEAAGHKRGIQTRGGGRGGLSDVETKPWMARTDCSSANGLDIADAVVNTADDRLKHFSAQPATDPQSLCPFLSQGLLCAQQSGCAAVIDTAGSLAAVVPPGTGSIATDIATRATKMARKVLMAWLQHYPRLQSGSSDGVMSSLEGGTFCFRRSLRTCETAAPNPCRRKIAAMTPPNRALDACDGESGGTNYRERTCHS
jgi:hypothetical protein